MTLMQLIAKLRRRGITFGVVDGLVRVEGWHLLSATEKEQLRADRDDVKVRLEARELRRQRRAERKKQQQAAMPQEQKERKVVGQVVNPGGPLKLLFEDECKPIAPSPRARQLPSVGWTKFMGGE